MWKVEFLCRRRFLEIVNQDSHSTWHYNHNPSKVGAVNIMEENEYIYPHLTALEFYSEGVLCGSNEVIDENEGYW